MTYQKKIFILLISFGLLALIYLGTFIFSADRLSGREASYAWLDPKAAPQAEGIELHGGSPLTLARRGGLWYAVIEDKDYPVKQERVGDLLNSLSARRAYPKAGTYSPSQETLGLAESAASRIIIRGGGPEPAVLLDLLIGRRDATGRDVYLRRNKQDEIRSGEDSFSQFLGSPSAWYNLRLFDGRLDMVQRVRVDAPPAEEGAAAPLVLVRSNQVWTVEGAAAENLDASRIESYVRGILEAEGDDFITGPAADESAFNQGQIRIEFGDGSSRTLRLGPPAGEGKQSARVSGSPYEYSVAQWTINRLFRDASSFTR